MVLKPWLSNQSRGSKIWRIPISCLHHHHGVLVAQIPLTLFHHPSLSSLRLSRSSMLHPVLVQSCCRYVLAGRPTLAHPCEGFDRSASLMSSSLFLQQCPACFDRLIWMVFEMGGRCPHSYWFVGILPPGLVQYSSQHSCTIAVKVFLHTPSQCPCGAFI